MIARGLEMLLDLRRCTIIMKESRYRIGWVLLGLSDISENIVERVRMQEF